MSIKYKKNTKASIKRLEVQIGQIVKKIDVNQITPLGVNTIDNPKEHYIDLVIEDAEQNSKEGVDG